MRKTTDYTPTLIEMIGAQKLKRTTDMLLSLPIIMTVTIVGVYFAVWRTDPLIRFIHMLWVLGFWMAGTVAMFASIIRARLNLDAPFPILMVASSPYLLRSISPLYRDLQTCSRVKQA